MCSRSDGCSQFDLKKRLRFYEEIKEVCATACYRAPATLLIRDVLVHIPVPFGLQAFNQVVNNYASGGKSFKDHMERLHNASREVADSLFAYAGAAERDATDRAAGKQGSEFGRAACRNRTGLPMSDEAAL